MSQVTILTIEHECEKGVMFKTAIKDGQNRPAMFALVRGIDDDGFHYNTLVFDGYCDGCGKRFQFSTLLENMLIYKEV